jgi:hypothetical protein
MFMTSAFVRCADGSSGTAEASDLRPIGVNNATSKGKLGR